MEKLMPSIAGRKLFGNFLFYFSNILSRHLERKFFDPMPSNIRNSSSQFSIFSHFFKKNFNSQFFSSHAIKYWKFLFSIFKLRLRGGFSIDTLLKGDLSDTLYFAKDF